MAKRANNEGSIRLRRDGLWEARYSAGTHPGTGKQIQRSIYGKTQKEVRQKLQKVALEIDSGLYTAPSKLTVGKWLDMWHKEFLGAVKSSTRISYEQQIKNHIKPAFNSIPLSSLKSAPIQKFYNDLQRKGLSPKTIKNIHGVFHKALQQAVLFGYIRSNPSSVCILPRIEKKEIHPLDSAEIKTFLDGIKGHRLEALFTVALFTGMRAGELLGLTWDRVNFEKGNITIDRQLLRPRTKEQSFRFGTLKNDKPRTIVPAPFIMSILMSHRTNQRQKQLLAGSTWKQGPDYVFTGELGGHASYWQLNYNLRKVLDKLGIAPRRFHDLRHTYAVTALRSGDDVKTVQGNLGHHTAAFTLDVYGHVTEEMRRDSASRMQAFIQSIRPAASQ